VGKDEIIRVWGINGTMYITRRPNVCFGYLSTTIRKPPPPSKLPMEWIGLIYSCDTE